MIEFIFGGNLITVVVTSELDTASVTESKGDLEEGEDVDSRTPNFCVLLHGAMKVTVF